MSSAASVILRLSRTKALRESGGANGQFGITSAIEMVLAVETTRWPAPGILGNAPLSLLHLRTRSHQRASLTTGLFASAKPEHSTSTKLGVAVIPAISPA